MPSDHEWRFIAVLGSCVLILGAGTASAETSALPESRLTSIAPMSATDIQAARELALSRPRERVDLFHSCSPEEQRYIENRMAFRNALISGPLVFIACFTPYYLLRDLNFGHTPTANERSMEFLKMVLLPTAALTALVVTVSYKITPPDAYVRKMLARMRNAPIQSDGNPRSDSQQEK